jgi:hypothetical protein
MRANRRFFSKEAVAFDPITINERPIQIALNDYKEREKFDRQQQVDRMEQLISKSLASVDQGDKEATRTLLTTLRQSYLSSNSDFEDREIELPLGELWAAAGPETISPFPPAQKISIRRSEIDEVITAAPAETAERAIAAAHS